MSGITGTIQTSHGVCAKKQKLTTRRLYWLIPIFQKRHSSSNWARLIQKVYHTDPLLCPKCNGSMRIISFIEDEETIKKILMHLDLWMPGNHEENWKTSRLAA